MSLMLPKIQHDERYKDMWEWDGPWPVPKKDAPLELVRELEEFRANNQSGEDENGMIILL